MVLDMPITPASFLSIPAKMFSCLIIVYLHMIMFCVFLIDLAAIFPMRSSCIVVSVFIGMFKNVTLTVFCNLSILFIACSETNFMHCLSSVYSFTIPLHVSGLLVACRAY
jgi:hypothetical protein